MEIFDETVGKNSTWLRPVAVSIAIAAYRSGIIPAAAVPKSISTVPPDSPSHAVLHGEPVKFSGACSAFYTRSIKPAAAASNLDAREQRVSNISPPSRRTAATNGRTKLFTVYRRSCNTILPSVFFYPFRSVPPSLSFFFISPGIFLAFGVGVLSALVTRQRVETTREIAAPLVSRLARFRCALFLLRPWIKRCLWFPDLEENTGKLR